MVDQTVCGFDVRWKFRQTIEACTPSGNPPIKITDIFWDAQLSHGTLKDIWEGESTRTDLQTLGKLLHVLRKRFKPDATLLDVLDVSPLDAQDLEASPSQEQASL